MVYYGFKSPGSSNSLAEFKVQSSMFKVDRRVVP